MNQLISNNMRDYCDLCGECGARDIGTIIREGGRLFVCNDDLCWWAVQYMTDGASDREMLQRGLSDATEEHDAEVWLAFEALLKRTKRYEEVMGGQ